MNHVATKIVLARREAESGVDFSPRVGAVCPHCKKTAKIYKTQPWDDSTRIRYHRCRNAACPIAAMGLTIKSIEIDQVGGG